MDTDKKDFSLLEFQFKRGYISEEKYNFHKSRGGTGAITRVKDYPRWVYEYLHSSRYSK